MKIISFAWTTKALLAGKKTATRREWNDDYARRFQEGEVVQAYNKSPRHGGKKIAEIRLTKAPFKQKLGDMTHNDFIKEGGYMLWEDFEDFAGRLDPDYNPDKELWVIEFELIGNKRNQSQLWLF